MDDITIEVLEDGQVKIATGAVDGDIHKRIDNFVEALKAALGGEAEVADNRPDHVTHSTRTTREARY